MIWVSIYSLINYAIATLMPGKEIMPMNYLIALVRKINISIQIDTMIPIDGKE